MMCSFKVFVLVAAAVSTAHADYYDGYNYNYNTYNRRGMDEILQRAADRTRYETELKVSCDTGDDRACFELFLSLHRMALYFTAATLIAIILLGICIGVCCYCKRKRRRQRADSLSRSRPGSLREQKEQARSRSTVID